MSIEAAFFGTLGKDAEPKTSTSSKPYLLLNVRVGENEGAQWVNVRMFDAAALATADKLVKGSRVYIEGRIKLDQWTTHDGANRAGLSCMSWHCHLAEIGRHKTKRTRQAGAPSVAAGSANFGGGTSQATPGDLDDEIPF
jgi:single-stranded DNA-binding protein